MVDLERVELSAHSLKGNCSNQTELQIQILHLLCDPKRPEDKNLLQILTKALEESF